MDSLSGDEILQLRFCTLQTLAESVIRTKKMIRIITVEMYHSYTHLYSVGMIIRFSRQDHEYLDISVVYLTVHTSISQIS